MCLFAVVTRWVFDDVTHHRFVVAAAAAHFIAAFAFAPCSFASCIVFVFVFPAAEEAVAAVAAAIVVSFLVLLLLLLLLLLPLIFVFFVLICCCSSTF